MLQVSNVKKVFETGREPYVALDGLSLAVATGEFICLLGPSGCGKSTLLNILAGFEPVTTGAVLVDDVPVTGAGRDRVWSVDASASGRGMGKGGRGGGAAGLDPVAKLIHRGLRRRRAAARGAERDECPEDQRARGHK